MALEIVTDQATKQSFPYEFDACSRLRMCGLANGLLLYARRTNHGRYGDWVMVSPPLIINDSELDDMVNRLEKTLGNFADIARLEGVHG